MPQLFWTAALLVNAGVLASTDAPGECPPAPRAVGKAHVSACVTPKIPCGTTPEVSRRAPHGKFELKLSCQLPSEIVPAKPWKPIPTMKGLVEVFNGLIPHTLRGQTKPSASYLQDDVAYFPPPPVFPAPKTQVPPPRRIQRVEFERAPHPVAVKPRRAEFHSKDEVQFFPAGPECPLPPAMPVAGMAQPVACPPQACPVAMFPAYAPHPVPVFPAPGPQMPPIAYGMPHSGMRPFLPAPPMPVVAGLRCSIDDQQAPFPCMQTAFRAESCCKDGCKCQECQCPGCDQKKTATVPVYSDPAAGRMAQDTHVLCFEAAWCGPCRQMKPIVQELISHGCPLKVVDIDTHPELATKFHVNSIPAFVAIVDGKPCAREFGVTSAERIRALVNRVSNVKPNINGKHETKPAPESPANTSYPGAISVTKFVEVQYALPSQKGEMLANLLREQCSIEVKHHDDILTVTTTDEKQKAVANFIATVVGPSPPKMASQAERNIAKTTRKSRPAIKIQPPTVTFPGSDSRTQYRIRRAYVTPVKYKAPVAYPKAKTPARAESVRSSETTQGCTLTADSIVLKSPSKTPADNRFKLECGPQGVCVRQTDAEGHPLILKCQNLEAQFLGQLPKAIQCEFRKCLGLDKGEKDLMPSIISEEVRQILDDQVVPVIYTGDVPVIQSVSEAIEKNKVFSFTIGISR